MKKGMTILIAIVLFILFCFGLACVDKDDYNHLTTQEYRQILSEGKR